MFLISNIVQVLVFSFTVFFCALRNLASHKIQQIFTDIFYQEF